MKSINQKSGKVAFVGDGINDAPALSVADMWGLLWDGTDIATESEQMVLTTNNLLGVVRAFDMRVRKPFIILLNLFWELLSTMLGIPIAAGVFSGVGLALNPELAGV